MTRRIALLTAGLSLVLYAAQRLIRLPFNTIGASIVDYSWVVALAAAVPVLVAAWLIGRWRGLGGRRLIATSLLTYAATYCVWSLTGSMLDALSPLQALNGLGEVGIAALYFVMAGEAVAVSWPIAGLAMESAHTEPGHPADGGSARVM